MWNSPFPTSWIHPQASELHGSTQSAQQDKEYTINLLVSSEFRGTCFPELTMWNLNFQVTKFSSDTATVCFDIHTAAYLATILSLKDKWIVPRSQVWNESNSGHLTRTKVTYSCLHHSASSKAQSSGFGHCPQALGAAIIFLSWARCNKATEIENVPESSNLLGLIFAPSSTLQTFLLSRMGKPCTFYFWLLKSEKQKATYHNIAKTNCTTSQ